MTARLRRLLAAFTGPVRTVPVRDPKGRGQSWSRGAADGAIEVWAGVRRRETATDTNAEAGR